MKKRYGENTSLPGKDTGAVINGGKAVVLL